MFIVYNLLNMAGAELAGCEFATDCRGLRRNCLRVSGIYRSLGYRKPEIIKANLEPLLKQEASVEDQRLTSFIEEEGRQMAWEKGIEVRDIIDELGNLLSYSVVLRETRVPSPV